MAVRAKKPRPVYSWEAGCRLGGDPQAVGEELDRLRVGEEPLTPALVVDAAADPDSPLHRYFDWSDSSAARKYRECQARDLLRGCRVEYESRKGEMTPPVMAFIHSGGDFRRGYYPASQVITSKELMGQALEEAKKLLIGIRKRYAHLQKASAALGKVFGAIDELDGGAEAGD